MKLMKETLMSPLCGFVLPVSVIFMLGGLGLQSVSKTSAAVTEAQDNAKTLAERLGYSADAKLLIVHADDLGVAHSVDAASTRAFDIGSVSSGSIMVPCPWLAEIADYAKGHPEADLGLHLTLTSEWEFYRWGPVSSKDKVPTLLDHDGYLYPTEAGAAAHIDPKEAESEIQEQVDRAIAFGIRPTHLDSHMGTLFQTKPLFDALMRVAHQYKLPVLISRDFFTQASFIKDGMGSNDIAIDHIITIGPDVSAEHWADFYRDAIKNLKPGVTQFVIHLAYDDDEMRAITKNHPNWGAAWRQRDFDFFTSQECAKLLDENKVKLITWRQIGKLLEK
ncbi:MAG TPA: polysaccharide deacetylase family protein [Blastocatellia bacterium]|nr:polysaccharide deacetylase family protein [Blastocatellia bacterium]